MVDTLRFSAESDAVEVTPVGTSLLPVGEVGLTVFAMAAMTPARSFHCTEASAWESWAAVRE